MDTSIIERVEVVKGPNSTLWGVNAFGGVITDRRFRSWSIILLLGL